MASVIPQKNAKISEQNIIDYVARTLAFYKKPRKVIFVEELPYTPSGKPLKSILKSGMQVDLTEGLRRSWLYCALIFYRV